MPKGILKFKLPEESHEFKIAVQSMDWALVVWGIDQAIRTRLKYSPEGLDVKTLEWARGILRDEMDNRGVSMEDII